MPGMPGNRRGSGEKMANGAAKKTSPASPRNGPMQTTLRSSASTSSQSIETEQQWARRICREAQYNGYLVGLATTSAKELVPYEENDHQPPPRSAKALLALKFRFLNCLALAFGDEGAWNSPTIGMMHEDLTKDSITIRLARFDGRGECPTLSDTTKVFAQAFTRLHESSLSGQATYRSDLEWVVIRLYRTRTQQAVTRLQNLWRSKEDTIYDVIAKLSGIYDEDGPTARDEAMGDAIMIQPTRSAQTFVRTAKALRGFHTIKFLRCDVSVDRRSSPSRTNHAPVGGHAASLSTPSNTSTNEGGSTGSPCTDHDTLAAIDPAIKRAAYELAACVFENRLPDPQTESYYSFGFPACVTTEQTEKLGGLYRSILASSQSRLNELCKALATYQLFQFLDKHERQSIRLELPHLEGFLSTPLPERPTMFRLVQFLRSENDTNPPPVLIRDYGFHNCKMREEVEVVKDLYQQTLDRIDVFRLHIACLNNQLLEQVQATGVSIPLTHRRFFRNQGPRPELGYQKNTLPFKFDQGLFKHEKVKRMRMRLL